ncbi:MAG: DUF917 domain-containing protein [Alicyclobacillus sp.]|nr:DUF917 domain-containing protein [Alicyclobacillus sp.]
MNIGIEEVRDIARGATILGCGGGGDPDIGRLMAETAIAENGPVRLMDPMDLPDDTFVLASAMMGAPTVVIEKIPKGTEPLQAFRRMEAYLGKTAGAVCPMECGGLNSTIPILVAAQTGLPLLDGDGMGRAFPELQMETFSVYGVRGTPACVVDEDGNAVLCETERDADMEWLMRGVTIRMGGAAYLAHYPMTGADFKRTAVRNTMTLAHNLGKSVRLNRVRKESPVDTIRDAFAATDYGAVVEVFRGKVLDVQRETRRGFALGSVVVEGVDGFRGSQLRVSFQNENLVAWRDGIPVACVPDLIIFLDAEAGDAIPTERIHYGQRVTVLSVEAPPLMTSPEALKVWGPRAFGYGDLSLSDVRAHRVHIYQL